MARMTLRLVIALGLLTLGWAAGRAQTTRPDFTISVATPRGQTSDVQCMKGCRLAPVRAPSVAPTEPPQARVRTLCAEDNSPDGCSYVLAGWIAR